LPIFIDNAAGVRPSLLANAMMVWLRELTLRNGMRQYKLNAANVSLRFHLGLGFGMNLTVN